MDQTHFRRSAPITVKVLMEHLSKMPKDAFVLMAADAEGNAYHALFADGITEELAEGAVLLYPAHDSYIDWVTPDMRKMFGRG